MSETKILFTLCSNNYLAQASVLAQSAHAFHPDWKFFIGLVDKKNNQIDYKSFPCEMLDVAIVERDIRSMAEKYSIVELNTCVKPAYFNYFMETLGASQVIYLDPDTCLYAPMIEAEQRLSISDIVLTPHILTPIPLDGLTPQESLFLNYGIYNLGFIGLRRSENTKKFLQWWKDRTYVYGYDKPAIGLFTDQLWINLVPIYFQNVEILKSPGYNMAPWNLHERSLSHYEEKYIVNGNAPLVFFHFSGFDPQKEKLHKDYNRFEMSQRADLRKLFSDYKEKLESKNLENYKLFTCYYMQVRQEFLLTEASLAKTKSDNNYSQLSHYKKLVRQIKRYTPSVLKNSLLKFIRT